MRGRRCIICSRAHFTREFLEEVEEYDKVRNEYKKELQTLKMNVQVKEGYMGLLLDCMVRQKDESALAEK